MQREPEQDDPSGIQWTEIPGLKELVGSFAFPVLFAVIAWLVRLIARRFGVVPAEIQAFGSVLVLGTLGVVVVAMTVRELRRGQRDYPDVPTSGRAHEHEVSPS
jgi:hypothetical protein